MGALFSAPALVVYIFGGLWGFFLIAQYLVEKIGILLSLLSFILLPVVYYLAPIYAGIVDGYWLPLLVSYGSTLVAGLIYLLSQVSSGQGA